MRKILLALAISIFVIPNCYSGEVSIDVSLFPAGSFEITGKTIRVGKVSSADKSISVDQISVPKDSLVTGIELRDKHMRERIKEKNIVVSDIKASKGKGSGTITINGIKKKIGFTFEKDENEIEAKFKLNLEQFNIEDINYMGVGVENEVEVEIEFDLK